MIARETKRQKLVQKYAAKRSQFKQELRDATSIREVVLIHRQFRAYRVIVHRYAYITVVQKRVDQKASIVILVFHVMYYAKWHTNVSFQEYVNQVGKRHFLWLFTFWTAIDFCSKKNHN